MRGTILQPTYLPWLGYFEMIASTDIYVVFDHVQFVRKSWQQRNRIKTANGIIWLTVPVKKMPQNTKICDAKISYNQGNFLRKHWKTIELSYKKAKYFNEYMPIFEEIYSQEYEFLRDLNVRIIQSILDILGIKTKIVLSSQLDLNYEKMEKTEEVINLCKTVGITHLYDAEGAAEFIDTSLFYKEGISITFQHFEHPVYKQLWGDFIPYMSVIDLLFSEGDKGLDIIRNQRRESYTREIKIC